jgi:hypothetical protein
MGIQQRCLFATFRHETMEDELAAVADFVESNRRAMASYVRQKLLAADAKQYLDSLGKDGIAALDGEAAGVLLDLACALLRRLHPGRDYKAEEVLGQLPSNVQRAIRLPRSDAYHAVMAQLTKSKHSGDVPMIRGVHTMFYSSEPEALRAFLRDKLGFPCTDVGGGWLIFDLPEADMGCHPADKGDGQAASGTARRVVLLRRHREDRRRAEGARRRVHGADRRSRLRPGDALQGAGWVRSAAVSAALCQKPAGEVTAGRSAFAVRHEIRGGS